MTSDELLLEFVRQYRRLSTREQAQETLVNEHWRWAGKPQSATKADVDKKYVLLKVHSRTLSAEIAPDMNTAAVKKMTPAEQAELNAAVDQQFWDETQYKREERLGHTADDKEMAKYWRALRAEIIQQRKAIQDLPANVKKVLFTEGAPKKVQPRDYPTVLRVAEKLAGLSDEELADYKSKTNAETQDWAMFEKSMDGYVDDCNSRKDEAESREQQKTRIYGLEDLFQQYEDWKSLKSSASTMPTRDEFGVADRSAQAVKEKAEQAETTFFANLKRNKFDTVTAFEAALTAYEKKFQKETLRVAEDLLERYEHVLFVEEKKYQDPAQATSLHTAVAQSKAKQHYSAATEKRMSAFHAAPGGINVLKQLQEAAEEEKQGHAEVDKAAGTEHPLVRDENFDHRALAEASAGDVQGMMLEHIDARRGDIRKARGHLAKNPELVYEVPDLINASYLAQAIEPGNIFDLVVKKKISEVHSDKMLLKIVLGVITLALTILTFGTGALAAGAAVGAFGLSAYQAVEEFREYATKHSLYGAKLLAEDPSFAWVIVAIVGAGADLGVAAAALKAMKTAVDGFNVAVKAGDAAGGAVRLEKNLQDLTEVAAGIRRNVVRAARAEAELKGAFKSLVASGARLYGMVIPIPLEQIVDLVRVMYYLGKRGVIAFDTFVKELRASKLLGEGAIGAEDLAKLKKLFEDTKAMSQGLAKHGKSLSMKPSEIEAFLAKWPDKKGATLDELKEAMTKWKKGEPDNWFTSQEVDEMVTKIEAGDFKTGEPLELAPWKAAGKAKKTMGPQGKGTQAAHEGPRAALKNLPNYNPEDMLTRMMKKKIHSGMDAHWKKVFHARAAKGEKIITAQDLYEVVSESIRKAPGLSFAEKESHIAHLSDELFQQLGLSEKDLLRMPYSKP